MRPQEFEIFKRHLARLRSSLTAHSADQICKFITENTYLRGQNFSFFGHEYQKTILEDPSPNIVILKSAQIGISELSARLAVARSVLIPGFSTIYTLPSALAAQKFMKTRIDPIIDSSDYLREVVSKDIDNSSLKKFGESYLWLSGCQVDRQAISVPADSLIFDEVDNSSQEVMTLFESRIIHSQYKYTVKLSTPSIPKYGISAAFDTSKRRFHFARCEGCSQWFLPNYYEHVVVPGLAGDITEVNKRMFASNDFRWQESHLACPHCSKPVDLRTSQREWVCENPDDNYPDSGYKVSPFSCPHTITVSDLVRASVQFERPQDFMNQRLGEAMADSESTITQDDVENMLISGLDGFGAHSHVLGLDFGSVCHAVVAAVLADGKLIVRHVEQIPAHKVVERTVQLVNQYRIRQAVLDRGPLTEAVYQIQQKVINSFAAVFVQSKTIELYKVVDKEEDLSAGVAGMRQVNIAKDSVLDLILFKIRSGEILKVSDDQDAIWSEQLQDNKRVRIFKGGELVLSWVKTAGNDHYHMGLLYTWVASQILGVGRGSMAKLPLLTTANIKKKEESENKGWALSSGGIAVPR